MQLPSPPVASLVEAEKYPLSEPHGVFVEGSCSGLHCDAVVREPAQFRRYMQGMLRRYPANLKRHVQYILSLVDAPEKDEGAIRAALLDLFIVLENKGLPLRRRMLAVASPYLSKEAGSFFRNRLVSGITAATPLPAAGQSLLTGGYTGTGGFIRKVGNTAKTGYASLYEEAMSLMEYGDLAEARQLLVQALKMSPADEQVAAELVHLCTRLGDNETLTGLSGWFMANNLDLPPCWPLL